MSHAHAHIGEAKYATQIEASGFPITADEPISHGGGNTGPAPYDLLLASLGACTAITLRMYADRKQWSLASLNVDLHLVRDAGGTNRIERTLSAEGLDQAQRDRLVEIAERTPVTLTLKAGIPIHTIFS